jgi:ABC toxin-like protein/neuraminidase-like protein
MNRIIFPLNPGMTGAAVADLQECLQLFLEKNVFKLDEADRRALQELLRSEQREKVYGSVTHNLILRYQERNRLSATGEVDEPTANAFNALLEEFGAFDKTEADIKRLVGGQVRREDSNPFSGAVVRAFHVEERGALHLGEDTTDFKGRYTIHYAALPGEAAIHLQLVVLDSGGDALVESNVILDAQPLEIVDMVVPGVKATTFQVEGKVVSRVRAGVGGLLVQIVDKTIGDELNLAEAVTDESGAYRVTFTDISLRNRGKARPDMQARVFAVNKFLAASEVRYDATTHETLDVLLVNQNVVNGRILLDNGLAGKNLMMRVYDRGFGGAEKLLAEVGTSPDGAYALPYDFNGKAANLDFRVVGATGKEISLAATRFNAGGHEVMNLVIPGAAVPPMPPEYYLLTTDLVNHVGNVTNLADAREDDERQDLTLLHQATGWDARLIAVAATAAKLSAETQILPDVLYALFRVGLPMDKQQLAYVSMDNVEKALDKAQEAGIIKLDSQQIADAKAGFEQFARQTRLAVKAPGALSSLGDMLAGSVLSGNITDPQSEKSRFAEILFTHRGEAQELWQKAKDNGIPDEKIDGLRLQGKLAFLTLNNADLTATLQSEIEHPDNLSRLVEMDLYQPETWKARLRSMRVNDEALQSLIPPAYLSSKTDARENLAERLEAYSMDLSRKVWFISPTLVVGRMVENGPDKGGVSLGVDHETLKAPVRTFLKNAVNLGFELGRVSLDAFIRENRADLIKEISEDRFEDTVKSVKTLQRLYQITPTDESMKVLSREGFKSANDVVAFPYESFIDRFGPLFPSQEEAQLVYRKAQQVNAVTLNLVTIAKQLNSAPALYAISPPETVMNGSSPNVRSLSTTNRDTDSDASSSMTTQPMTVREKAKTKLISHFPTLESLFGSLDYCECEHCRSVLSPAAYFVDLLHFLDPEENVWKNTMDIWKQRHVGAPYPFKDLSEWEPFKAKWKSEHPDQPDAEPNTEKSPYEVLVERRPDLPHLQLTCENTNTTLPLIDLVNEILEFYVANNAVKKSGMEGFAGYDTGTVTTPELLAEPQNIVSAAYNHLKEARYPLTLPFDLWLETVRRFFEHFETPLWQVMETFRPSDELFASAQAYDRAAIFAEYLGISPSEYAVFTDSDLMGRWFELYGYNTEGEALEVAVDENGQRIDLNSAKALSRRLGVSYKEVAEIIQASFVNPELDALSIVWKIGLGVSDVVRYLKEKGNPEYAAEKEAFEERLQSLLQETSSTLALTDLIVKLDGLKDRFRRALVLRDRSTSCNFDTTQIEYADPIDPSKPFADALVFLRINLFVRLWKKLGWTIEETDQALRVFVPGDIQTLTAGNIGEWLRTALFYLVHLKSLDERVKIGKNSRLRLLTIWSKLSTAGKNPLYAQLFLSRSVLKNDPVFDDPLGEYLSKEGIEKTAQATRFLVIEEQVAPTDKLDPQAFSQEQGIWVSYDEIRAEQQLTFLGILTDQKKDELKAAHPSKVFESLLNKVQKQAKEFFFVKGHLVAIQGALNLTADEIGSILADAEMKLETAELSLDNISSLYRYGLLAKALKLPVRDLLALKALTGLDPCKPLSATPITKIDDDHPFNKTLRFVEMVELVKESGFGIEDLDYLLRHRFDPVGKYRSDPNAPLMLVKTLAAELRRIRAEQAVPSDPKIITDDLLREKLNLTLPADVVEKFFGFLRDSLEFSAKIENVSKDQKLDPTIYEVDGIRVAYDATRKWQRVTHIGMLTDDRKSAILGKIAAPAADAPQDRKDAYVNFTGLLDEIATLSQSQAEEFLEGYFKGVLTYDDLYGIAAAGLTIEAKRQRLLAFFLPVIVQKLSRQAVVQTLAASLNADPALTEALLADLLTELGLPGEMLLDAFGSADKRGVSVIFFDDLGNPLKKETMASADTKLKDDSGQAIKPGNAQGVRFEGYLEVPAAGAYRFFAIFGKKDTEAEMRFAYSPDPVIRGKASKDEDEISQFVELKPGVPYRFTLEARELGGGDISLLVQGENLPKGSLDRLALYPEMIVERVRRSQVLLAKALQIIQGFGFSEREVRHFQTHVNDFGGLDLSKLPAQEGGSSASDPVMLFNHFIRLAEYAHLKRELANGTDDLIDVFESARITYPASTDTDKAQIDLLANLSKLIAALTRREISTIQATAGHLRFTARSMPVGSNILVEARDFTQERGLRRLWDTLQVIEKLRIPVDAVARCATPDPNFDVASELKNVVKAHYEVEIWQRIARPIFDKLRQRSRDALVAYILHRGGFERLEQLFEYFLIDPGTEPVVQTSRIQLAISSVQLYIQRCLLNLEPQVHPSVIDSKYWEEMKRYRVWEAVRKIFLFPENWLEPEFRDDKTHLFQELESALLQGDVSNDLAEDAFFKYLKGLEEIARLDMVTMYCEEKPGPDSNVVHLVGRTFNLPHKYFYRRQEHNSWTNWVPVTAEIEGDHVAAVVWRGRLHLFWMTFLEKGDLNDNNQGVPGTIGAMLGKTVPDVARKQVEIQLNWSEYFQGQWTTRESSGFGNQISVNVPNDFNSREVFIHVTKEFEGDREGAVKIHLHFKRTTQSDNTKTVQPLDTALTVVSKNSRPKFDAGAPPQESPYLDNDIVVNKAATRYECSGVLQIIDREETVTERGKPPVIKPNYEIILQKTGDFSLVFCHSPDEPSTEDEIEAAKIRLLAGPFIFQDDRHAFFVRPTLLAHTVEKTDDYILFQRFQAESGWIGNIINPGVPINQKVVPVDIDPRANFQIQTSPDWLSQPAATVRFGNRLVGAGGGLDNFNTKF